MAIDSHLRADFDGSDSKRRRALWIDGRRRRVAGRPRGSWDQGGCGSHASFTVPIRCHPEAAGLTYVPAPARLDHPSR